MRHAAGNRLETNRSYHANPNWQHVRALVLNELFTVYQLLHLTVCLRKPEYIHLVPEDRESSGKGMEGFAAVPKASHIHV